MTSEPHEGEAVAPAASPIDVLLDVQDHDLRIDQMRHRKATLPERTELIGVEKSLAGLDGQLVGVEARQGELAARQGELESSIDAAGARIKTIERQLYHGQGLAFRDQEAMMGEVKSLEARRSHLEDLELEVMEELEPVDSEVAGLRAQRAALLASAEDLRGAIRAGESELDAEIAVATGERATLVERLPPALSAEYEKLRSKLGGVGAARLVHGSCDGCHLALPATEIDRIRHSAPGTAFHCDQCGRILVP